MIDFHSRRLYCQLNSILEVILSMKILNALDKKTGKNYNITELIGLNENSPVLTRLVCKNCGCPLSFYKPIGDRVAYLKTKNSHSHSKDCENYFEHSERASLLAAGKIVEERIDPNSMRRRLKRMNDKLFNKEAKKDKPTLNLEPKKRKNPRVTRNTKRGSYSRIVPTTKMNVSSTDAGKRGHMRMKYMRISEIGSKSLNSTIFTGGFLQSVELNENDHEHALLIIAYEGSKLRIQLLPDIFQYMIGLFDRLKALKKIIVTYKPQVAAAVEIIPDRNDNIISVLRDEAAASFDGLRLSVFLSKQVR